MSEGIEKKIELRKARWEWKRHEQRMEALEWLDEDAIPFLDPYMGTEIFAEALGNAGWPIPMTTCLSRC